MGYSLGFDGGGTKTECVVLDARGTVVGEGRGGPSNPLRTGYETSFHSLSEAAAEALKNASLHTGNITGVCAGLAGAGRRNVVRRMLVFLAQEFPGAVAQVVTDYEIALEAAAGTGPGVVLIAGTGSTAYGRNAKGETAHAGGYGPWVGDEGSAFEIGRRAVGAVARTRDHAAPVTLLTEMIPAALDCPDWDEFTQRIMKNPDEIFPALFPVVARGGRRRRQCREGNSVHGCDRPGKSRHDRRAPFGNERRGISAGKMRRRVRSQPNAGRASGFRPGQRRAARESFAS